MFCSSALIFCSHVLQFLLGVGLLTSYLFKIKFIQVEIFSYVYEKKERKYLHPAIKEKTAHVDMSECFII